MASNIVYNQLLAYQFDSHLARLHQKSRNSRSQRSIQKGGIVYANDVRLFTRLLTGDDNERLLDMWEKMGLSDDQKLYRLVFYQYVQPQLLLRTADRRNQCNKDGVNCITRWLRKA
jgi:hypothetical protein